MAELFRKKSLERLSNPDQLDQAVVVSSTMSWVLVLSFFIIITGVTVWSFIGTLPTVYNTSGIFVSKTNVSAIYSDASGIVETVKVKQGEKIKEGDIIAKVETADGEKNKIKAECDGVISHVLIEKSDYIYTGGEIARYTPDVESDDLVVCFVPFVDAQKLKEDMKTKIYVMGVNGRDYGYMEGTVIEVGKYAVNVSNLSFVVGSNNLIAEQFTSQGPVVSVICSLKQDSTSLNGYSWSSKKGKDLSLMRGDLLEVKIVTDEIKPISKLFHNVEQLFD